VESVPIISWNTHFSEGVGERPNDDNTFIGLDVHKATISVAIAQGERGG
jgi:hypothetical protein